jgi:hypothetical protein
VIVPGQAHRTIAACTLRRARRRSAEFAGCGSDELLPAERDNPDSSGDPPAFGLFAALNSGTVVEFAAAK